MPADRPRVAQACASIAFYMVCSTVMMPLNKVVMVQMSRAPLVAVGGQMFGAAAILACVPQTYEATHDELLRVLVLPPIFAGMLATSMLSLRFASIGAVMAVRNLSPLLALPLEQLLLSESSRRRITRHTVGSLLCVVGGCVTYVWNDMHTTSTGILLAAVNTALGVVDRLVQRHLLSEVQLSKCSLLFVNNLLGGCLVVAASVGVGEHVAAAGALLLRPDVRVPWALSVVVGLLLGYSGALAQSYVSATTHLLTTNINRLLSMVLSSFVLGEAITWNGYVSAVILLVGAIWYSIIT